MQRSCFFLNFEAYLRLSNALAAFSFSPYPRFLLAFRIGILLYIISSLSKLIRVNVNLLLTLASRAKLEDGERFARG